MVYVRDRDHERMCEKCLLMELWDEYVLVELQVVENLIEQFQ